MLSAFLDQGEDGQSALVVKLLPNEEEITFEFDDGYASFEYRGLDIFDMYMTESK